MIESSWHFPTSSDTGTIALTDELLDRQRTRTEDATGGMSTVLEIALLSSFGLPSTVFVYSAPILKWLYAAAILTLEIMKMTCSICVIWLWELAINTELIDALAFLLSVWISTSVLLDMFSYEIVITLNSNENLEYE